MSAQDPPSEPPARAGAEPAVAPPPEDETTEPGAAPEPPADGTLAQRPDQAARAADRSIHAPPRTPAAIPGYEVLGELARGGMGVVYRARQLSLNRTVALKMVLGGGHADPVARARFLVEAEAVAALDHPHVVGVYDFGEHDGLPYLAMEFVGGGSLADLVRREGKLPPREAAGLVAKLADGVAAAHAKGIVHRDLKPANVLLDDHGEPKVTDFGLAKVGKSDMTGTGAVLGTPSYMSPEQAAGRTKEVGTAADVYSLGAILYDLLTGRPPFRAETAVGTIQQVLTRQPQPPRSVFRSVPRDLETVCLKCLEKDPRRRYAAAADLAADLRAFLAGRPVAARPVGSLGRCWRWCRANPVVAALLALVAASLAGGSVTAAAFAVKAGREREAAEDARRGEAGRAEAEAAAKREAEAARRGAQRQLVEMCGASGLKASADRDDALALLWFARAVELAAGEPDLEELNRVRVANWLRHVCLPEGSFAVPGFRPNRDRFRSFAFSPDGAYLAAATTAGGCLVWDRAGGRLVPLPGPAAKAAAWRPGGGLLAVGGDDGKVRLLAPPGFGREGELEAGGGVVALAFSPDGRRLAWGGGSSARVWDLKDGGYVTPPLPHDGAVESISFSSDGGMLATAARSGRGGKTRVFPVPSDDAEPLYPPVPHTFGEEEYAHGGAAPFAPRFAAGDRVLLTPTPDPPGVRGLVWRSASGGKAQATADPGAASPFSGFAVSPDGTLVAGFWEGRGRLWDARTRQLLAPIPPTIWADEAVFSADGRTLIACGDGTRVHFWSAYDRPGDSLAVAVPPLNLPSPGVRVAPTADGKHLAVALWDGGVYLWRMPEGPPVAYSAPAGGAALPALSPDGRHVMPRGVTYRGGTELATRVFDAETGEAAGPVLDPGGILLDAAFSPDGTRVATAGSTARDPKDRNARLFLPDGRGGTVQLWDWREGRRVGDPVPMPAEPRGLAFRPDGRALAVVCADYHVVLLDPAAGGITRRLDPGVRTRPGNANQWFSNGEARFSPDGRFLVTWELSPHVHVWDPDSGRLLFALPHGARVHHVAFNPADPGVMATAGWENEARVWDLRTGAVLARLPHPRGAWPVGFSPDGGELVTGEGDGLLRVWDWRAGRMKDGWAVHPGPVRDFAVTPDGRRVVTVSDSELQVSDWGARAPVSPRWSVKPMFVLGMRVPPGERRVVVGGFADSLAGFDLGRMLGPAAGSPDELVRLAELAAGRRVLSRGNVVPLAAADWADRWRRGRPTP